MTPVDPFEKVLGGGSEAPKTPPASRSVSDPFAAVLGSGGSVVEVEKRKEKGLGTRSVITWFGGKAPSEYLDGTEVAKALRTFLPSGSTSNNTQRFITEVYRLGGGEMLDFATSPTGIGLMALHVIPQTRPVAMAADYVLGAEQTVEAARAFDDFRKTKSPESLAAGFVASIGAFGGLRAGRHMLEKHVPAYKSTPPSMRASQADYATVLAEPSRPARVLKLQEMAEPKTTGQKLKQRMYATPVVRNVASMLNVPKPRLLEIGQDIVNDRTSFSTVNKQRVRYALHEIKKSVHPSELTVEKMGYVLEGDLTPAEAGLSPQATRAVGALRKISRDQTEMLREAYGDDIPLRDAETYLAHMWEFKDAGARRKAAYTIMKDPFLKERKVGTYKEGIESGWQPKFNNVLDIIEARSDFAIKAAANQRMANALREMGAILSEDEVKAMSRGGQKARQAVTTHGGMLSPNIARAENVAGWREAVDSRALHRATYVGKTERGTPVMERRPVYIHPEIEQSVNAVFGRPFEHKAFDAVEAVRAWGKKTSLMWSFFHHNALSEQGQAIAATRGSLGQRVAGAAKATWFMNPEYYKGTATGMWEIGGKVGPHDPPAMRLEKQPIVMDALRHGLSLTTEDMESRASSQMQRTGLGRGKVVRAALAPVRGIGKTMHVMDRGLWDFYHQGQMINAYETILASELERYRKLGSPLDEGQVGNLKQSIADHVNNAYGALNFERMLVSPKMRQFMNFAMLAPSWTISNIRVFTQALESDTGKRLSAQYAVGALVSWFVTANMMNYALSSYYGGVTNDGQRHEPGKNNGWFLWDNAGAPMTWNGKPVGGLSERAISVYAGYNLRPDGSQGTQRYINWGKGFKEPFVEAMRPWESMLAKSSLPVRTAAVLVTGHEPGSGFEVVDPKATPTEQTWQRWTALSDLAIPFVFRDYVQYGEHLLMPETFAKPSQSSQYFSLPASSGLSVTRATGLYVDAMDRGDTGTAEAVLKAAEYNNLKVASIIAGYRDRMRKRERNRGRD